MVQPVANEEELSAAMAQARGFQKLNGLSPEAPAYLVIVPDGEITSEEIRLALARAGLALSFVFIFERVKTLESVPAQIDAAMTYFGLSYEEVLPIVTRALRLIVRPEIDLRAISGFPEGVMKTILLSLLNQLTTIDSLAVKGSADASVAGARAARRAA